MKLCTKKRLALAVLAIYAIAVTAHIYSSVVMGGQPVAAWRWYWTPWLAPWVPSIPIPVPV